MTYINRGHFYAPHVMPVLLDCNFIVDSTNGNGFGVRALKGQGIDAVFMATSATPGRTRLGYLNPNPQAGVILVKLSNNYNRYFSGTAGFVAPLSGTPLTSVTAGTAYVIVALGTATQAQWVTLGLPPGITPALGCAFIAITSASIPGSGAVEVPATAGSNIDHIEPVGDPNTTLMPTPLGASPNIGGWLVLNCIKANALTAPAAGTSIGLTFYLSQSSVMVKGE